MRILSLNTFTDASDSTGGAEKTRELLMAQLVARGHDVCGVGTSELAGEGQKEFEGIRRERVKLKNLYWQGQGKAQPDWKRFIWHALDIYNFGMQRSLDKVLNLERPDVVMLHNIVGWSVAVIGAIKRRGIPMIHILHDYYNICPNSMMFKSDRNCEGQCASCWLMRAPHRVATNDVDAVVGVSQYVLDRHLRHGAFTKVPIKRVIHNTRSAASLGLAEGPALRAAALGDRAGVALRFGYIGALIPSKGVESLIDAFAAIDRADVELWVAGSGPAEQVERLIARSHPRKVRFLGQVKPKDFFTAVDVTIVPSLWQENYPGVVAESFAFGVPVVGSRRGGVPEMIRPGYDGFLFEPDDPQALVRIMRQLASAPDELASFKSNAEVSAKPFLDVETWGATYDALMAEVFEARRNFNR